MSNPANRAPGPAGESRNAHFGDAVGTAHGFDVQRWIDDGAVIDDARGDVTKPMRHEDPDLDFYDD